ncbi:hypothetical protein SAMN05421743_12147 [Thalassobacillus cyri]|uniref:Uncharacterized protein n=1 Tax=Thalassobacillus cyri TaxID=571932 RepID=A0A1H4H3Z1_9BACI|nr:hypothetical protein [Thalassobacillus cyri]SEB15808.1 hypothetical protein SAMN05421743_12147 [Thalassobacillus cyri]
MAKPSKVKQNEMIQEEIDRLNSIVIDMPESVREAVKELIERLAFMTIQLEILEETIKTKGPTYTYKNGSQKMLIENPAQKSYNTTMNRYTAAYDKLIKLVEISLRNNPEDDADEYEDI